MAVPTANQLEPPQRVPHSADADRDGELLQDPGPQLIQCYVGLSGHLRRNRLIVLRKLRRCVRRLRPRRHLAKPITPLSRLHNIGCADPIPPSYLPTPNAIRR